MHNKARMSAGSEFHTVGAATQKLREHRTLRDHSKRTMCNKYVNTKQGSKGVLSHLTQTHTLQVTRG